MEEKRQNQIKEWISENPQAIVLLKLLREFDQKQSNVNRTWLSAGYVRSLVWNKIFNVSTSSQQADVDLIYFDSNDLSEARVKELKVFLEKKSQNAVWDIKNQAFAWKKNGDEPYRCIEDAISCWPETVTAIAIILEEQEEIKILAPFGTKDLLQGVVKPTPHFLLQKIEQYRFRQNEKKWWERWPKIRILEIQNRGEF